MIPPIETQTPCGKDFSGKKSISCKLCGPIPLVMFFSGKALPFEKNELEIILIPIWGLVTISHLPFKSMVLKTNHT